MTFTQLRTFALVAELGSLRAAAAALGVSEPAVSASIAALRTDLGDPLFRRTSTGSEVHAVPFLRYQRVMVAAPGHPVCRRTALRSGDLAGVRWFAGPGGLENGSEEHRWASGADGEVTPLDSEAEARAAVRAGRGILLALEHAVRDDLRD